MLMRTFAAMLFATVTSTAALAEDRAPSDDELAAITAALEAAGYSSWEEIELDDGVWEVDDAVHADGNKYDLKLAVDSLEVTEQELD